MQKSAETLTRANGAMVRRDYLSALHLAMQAKGQAGPEMHARCDALFLLALSSMEMGMEFEALAWAIGAHLAACFVADADREARASSLVAMVVSQFPHLQEGIPDYRFH